MTQIAIARRKGVMESTQLPRVPRIQLNSPGKTMLGARTVSTRPESRSQRDDPEDSFSVEPKETTPSKQTTPSIVSVVLAGETIEKVVRRIPTLYVIALFGVIVLCAVLTIWNTLQVNKLTLERTHNEQRLEESEQRLVKLRAEEMQLGAPSRIRQLAESKLGMTDAQREDLVLVR
jgi:cell division protein FtsL